MTPRQFIIAADRNGASSTDARDKRDGVDWTDPTSVERSYWFKGYRERVKGALDTLAQVKVRVSENINYK